MIRSKEDLKREVTSATGKGDLMLAINTTIRYTDDKEVLHTLYVIRGRLGLLNRDIRRGIVGYNKRDKIRSEIVEALYDCIADISPENFLAKPGELYKIIVIESVNKEDQEGLKEFFEKVELSVEYQTPEDCLKNLTVTDNPELIIFDNRFWSKFEYRSQSLERQEFMVDMVEQKKDLLGDRLQLPFFLHLGDKWEDMNLYNEHFQAANSLFSLYSRVLEVLEFVTFYNFKK